MRKKVLKSVSKTNVIDTGTVIIFFFISITIFYGLQAEVPALLGFFTNFISPIISLPHPFNLQNENNQMF